MFTHTFYTENFDSIMYLNFAWLYSIFIIYRVSKSKLFSYCRANEKDVILCQDKLAYFLFCFSFGGRSAHWWAISAGSTYNYLLLIKLCRTNVRVNGFVWKLELLKCASNRLQQTNHPPPTSPTQHTTREKNINSLKFNVFSLFFFG